MKEEGSSSSNSKTDVTAYLSLVFFGTIIIFGLGLKHAKDKEYYITIKGRENSVAIEIYGDNIVLKKFDPDTKIMPNEFSILKISNENEIELSKKKIGPLISEGP